VAFGLVCQVG